MIGCVNVLSRLKNPGIRINPPVIDRFFVRNSAVLPPHVATASDREPKENIGTAEPGSGTLHYFDDFTAPLPLLVNFEQFEEFPGKKRRRLSTEVYRQIRPLLQPGVSGHRHPRLPVLLDGCVERCGQQEGPLRKQSYSMRRYTSLSLDIAGFSAAMRLIDLAIGTDFAGVLCSSE